MLLVYIFLGTTAGAGSSMIGNLISVGAITIGADIKWTGDLTTESVRVPNKMATEVGANSVDTMVVLQHS
jgi:hypothetical protein